LLMLNMHQKGGIIYKVDGQCTCFRSAYARLPTFPQMFIPCSKHGPLNNIITVQNLKINE
jgi:hypothetical protein